MITKDRSLVSDQKMGSAKYLTEYSAESDCSARATETEGQNSAFLKKKSGKKSKKGNKLLYSPDIPNEF
jgi:hypothetical protein